MDNISKLVFLVLSVILLASFVEVLNPISNSSKTDIEKKVKSDQLEY